MSRALREASGAVRRLAAAHRPSPADDIAGALGRLLAAIEAEHAEGPISALYAGALVRHGRYLAKAGGAEALRAALDTVCAAVPDRADERRMMITAAWAAILETKL